MPGASAPQSSGEIVPRRAPVGPRARWPDSQASLPLDQIVLSIARKNSCGAVYLKGPAGSGKTTALCHLKAVLPTDIRIGLFDEPRYEHWKGAAESVVAVVTTQGQFASQRIAALELAPWTEDDCLEYLASKHRDQCARIMQMVRADNTVAKLDGSPELLSIVMDAMAADAVLRSTSDAIRAQQQELFPAEPLRGLLARECIRATNHGHPPLLNDVDAGKMDAIAKRVLRRRGLQLVLSAECLADQICQKAECPQLRERLAFDLLMELAAALKARPAETYRDLLQQKIIHPGVSASLELALDPVWRPKRRRRANLTGAYLSRAKWEGIDLSFSDLSLARLNCSDLRSANLDSCTAIGTDFTGAMLRSVSLERALLSGAQFGGADLTSARIYEADLSLAGLERAMLSLADLSQSVLCQANLKSADLLGAKLIGARLDCTLVSGADFSGADFLDAKLELVDMSEAIWTRARFVRAQLFRCILAGLELPEADFTAARLTGSDLTSTRILNGKFIGASLCRTGLAEIDWENADLRDADFTHASFHMGSSRSGLVGSVIASEGSRTGFYTDEFNEQDFKSPEEIRKANLCGADLRGAKVTGTDWYLVDLRGAKCTPDQAEHFARCGAILHSRSDPDNE